jgi:putative ABC transport system permease protein
MIASAALLAFVVLYNLNNINISERRRELATFKVLGFTNSELATYVYRENVILTALGIIVGTITGVILHRIVMITVETDMYMFGRELNFASIVLATLLTILFTVIINEVMRKKLQKIDMIESLKSVE